MNYTDSDTITITNANATGVKTLGSISAAGTGYTEEKIQVTGVISVMRAGTTNGRIRGGVWGR